MTIRVGINGFGRVGRCAFRSAFESGAPWRLSTLSGICTGASVWACPSTTAAPSLSTAPSNA